MDKQDIVSEGKTKIVLRCPGGYTNRVKIESKPVLSKADGEIKERLEDKDILATTTTCNVFELLNSRGLSTHFIKQLDERTFLAHLLSMLPIEVVARRIAKGSYLPRNPEIADGSIFENIVIELFFKDDARHDPIMEWNPNKGCFDLYQPKAPISSKTYLGEYYLDNERLKISIEEAIEIITEMQKKIFLNLEEAFRKQGITLIDMKCEFGIDADGNIRLGDVVDNDSWRIEKNGEFLDKQIFRNAEIMTSSVESKLKENYALVAEVTKLFLAAA